MSGRGSRGSFGVFLAVAVLLCVACAALWLAAERQTTEYRALAARTPTPTAVPRKVSYLYDSQTPQPTALHMGVGAMGQTVYDVQVRLQALGYYPYDPDGKFGAGTQDAVQRFQTQNGLAADGIVGGETYSRLMSPDAIPAAAAQAE